MSSAPPSHGAATEASQSLTVATSMFIGVAVALIATACAQSDTGAQTATTPAAPTAAPAPAPAGTDHGMAGHSAGSMELHRLMTEGAKQSTSMPMAGDVDKDFASMMTMHHEQGIKMSEVMLQHGKSEELKAIARKIADAQRKEIEEMRPFRG